MKNTPINRIDSAKRIFMAHGGTMRTQEALAAGIHPEVLYQMRDTALLERLTRGLYRLADSPKLGNPDLVTVAMKIPKGVVCLISALSFHNITTQIPHAIDIALIRGAETPRIDYPPVNIYWSVERIFNRGVVAENVDGRSVRIYSPEKTIVDCFRYRNKIGLDTAIEALRLYRERKRFKADDLMLCARICRAEKLIKPYVEGVL